MAEKVTVLSDTPGCHLSGRSRDTFITDNDEEKNMKSKLTARRSDERRRLAPERATSAPGAAAGDLILKSSLTVRPSRRFIHRGDARSGCGLDAAISPSADRREPIMHRTKIKVTVLAALASLVPTQSRRGVMTMLKVAGIAAVALTAAALVAPSFAHAVAYGEPDGNRHPYTAALVAERDSSGDKQPFCSGALIAPRVVVTAAHCVWPLDFGGIALDKVWVSFDPVYSSGTSTVYHGTFVRNPNFNGYAGQHGNSNPHDVAVVRLDEAPPITPARLPAANLLSSMDLRGQTFTVVGYGLTKDDKTSGPNNIRPNADPTVRNAGTVGFRSLQSYWLTTEENPALGYASGCDGDSGGPYLLGDSDLVVALVTQGDSVCRSLARNYRLDTDSARQFLASQGVPLP